jgi:hypothetical protein
MSPEQILGTDIDERADVFSLGVVLFEMATGRRPYASLDPIYLAIAWTKALPRADAVDSSVPRRFADVIAKMMALDPQNRFQSAADVQSALAVLSGGDRRAWPSVVTRGRLSMTLLLVPLGIELLGFLVSTSFNRTIGLTERFGWESPGAWFVWGVRSLVPSVVYWTIILIAIAGLRAMGRLLSERSPRMYRVLRSTRDRTAALREKLGLDDPAVVVQAVAVFGSIALAAVLWRYADLIHAFWSPISDMLPEQLASLRPDNPERGVYRIALSLLILALTCGLWYSFDLRSRHRVVGRSGWLTVGFVVLIATVVFHAIPYRVFSHSEFERADLNGVACYVLGENRIEVLVHCPAIDPPRNRIIKRGDRALTRRGVIASVYDRQR